MQYEQVRATELCPGDVILAGLNDRPATITGFSERQAGSSPVKGGVVIHLSGAPNMSAFPRDWHRRVTDGA